MIPSDNQNEHEPGTDEKQGGSSKLLLGVLVVLLVVVGYLYFFTGVIRERGEESQNLPTGPQQIKQPMPPRPEAQQTGQQVKADVQQKPKSLPTTPKVSPAPTAHGAAPTATSKAPEAKPKSTASHATAKPAAPAKAVKQAEKTPAKKSEHPETAAKSVPKKEAPAKATAAVSYSVETSDIFSAKKTDRIIALLKKGGLKNVERQVHSKDHQMIRLFVAEFDDLDVLRSEMKNLRKVTNDVFTLQIGGKYELYAGSYDKEQSADTEVKRLAGKGIKITPKKTLVKLQVSRVIALAKDEKSAGDWVKRLTKMGVDAKVYSVGK